MSAAEHIVSSVEHAVVGELMPANPIATLDVFRSQLAALEADEASLVFDLTTPAGIKLCKSHIYNLRRTKAPIEEARKAAKADALAITRRVDATGRELIEWVDRMIDAREEPLLAMERAEAERVARIQAVRDRVDGAVASPGMTSVQIQALMLQLAQEPVGPDLEEFQAEVEELLRQRAEDLIAAFDAAELREKQVAELEQLRAEKAERDRIERERQIAEQAAAKAKADAEQAAENGRLALEAATRREQDAAAQRERDATARAVKAEADAKAAEERVAQAARDAEERVRRETEEARAADAAKEAARAADVEHRRKVNAEAVAAIQKQTGLKHGEAVNVVTAIIKGYVPNVKVTY